MEEKKTFPFSWQFIVCIIIVMEEKQSALMADVRVDKNDREIAEALLAIMKQQYLFVALGLR